MDTCGDPNRKRDSQQVQACGVSTSQRQRRWSPARCVASTPYGCHGPRYGAAWPLCAPSPLQAAPFCAPLLACAVRSRAVAALLCAGGAPLLAVRETSALPPPTIFQTIQIIAHHSERIANCQ